MRRHDFVSKFLKLEEELPYISCKEPSRLMISTRPQVDIVCSMEFTEGLLVDHTNCSFWCEVYFQ